MDSNRDNENARVFKMVKDFYRANGKKIEKYTNELLRHVRDKENPVSEALRKNGNALYQNREFESSILLLTKSLCWATYNGKEYGLALASRSAVLFSLDDYENCIKDLELCLKTEYPLLLRPKIYIRLIKCYSHMGRLDKMQEVLNTCIELVKTLSDKEIADKYYQTIKDLVNNITIKEIVPKENYDIIPVIDENPLFANASKCVNFNYNSTLGPHVVATENINCGDVIFVEKCYTAVSNNLQPESEQVHHYCDSCIKRVKSSVPCKTCVKMIYCNEDCRDDDWNRYHKWECMLYRAKKMDVRNKMKLVLRTLLKAGDTALVNHKIDYNESLNPYNDRNEAYKNICNFPSEVLKLQEEQPDLFYEIMRDSIIIAHYLKVHSDVFNEAKKLPQWAEVRNQRLLIQIGSLVFRLCICSLHKSFRIISAEKDEQFFEEQVIGEGFYPFAAQLTHSCVPNTHNYFMGDTVVVKATKQIKSGDIVYFSVVHYPHNQVSKEVLPALCISCNCGICTGKDFDKRNYERRVCAKCGGSLQMVEGALRDLYICENCTHIFSEPMLFAADFQFLFYTSMCTYNRSDDVKAKAALGAMSRSFKPFHPLFKIGYIKFFTICSKIGQAVEFLELLPTVNKFFLTRSGNFSFEYGSYLIFLCSSIVSLITINKSIGSSNIRKLIEEVKVRMVTAKKIMKVFNPSLLKVLDELDRELQLICFKYTLAITEK